jgi:SAM-dependent methyltransferase
MIDRELNYGRHILDRVTRSLSDLNYPNILDIGAGKGHDLMIAKQNISSSILNALEAYPPNVQILIKKNINVYSLDIERNDYPFPSKSMDLVIANQILEHCKEIFWIFHEMSRVLKVGGRLYIGVPNLASLHSRFLLLFGRQPTCIRSASAHIRGFTKVDILNFLNLCAPDLYSVELFTGSNYYPFPPFVANLLSRFLPNSSVCIFFVLKKKRDYNSEFIRYPTNQHLETNFWIG